MKKEFKSFLIGFVFTVLCIICFKIGQEHPKQNYTKVEIKRDTLVVKDTIKIEKPIEKVRIKDKIVYIPVKDTLRLKDTLFLSLEKEKVIYEDSSYKAIISGIEPKLEEIEVYPKNIYITEKQKEIQYIKRKFNINISMGPGVFYNGNKIDYGIGVLFGVGYSF